MRDTPERDADSGTSADPIAEQRSRQKLHTQLYWRLGVAIVLIGIVIGALRLLDRPKPVAPAPQIATPSPIASAPSVETEPTPAPEPQPTEAPETPTAAPPTSAAPRAPTTAMPPAQHAEQPATTSTPATQAPRASATKATTTQATSQQDTPGLAATAPTIAQHANGYTVQAGVFLHSDNAEKLLRKLQAAGVPAYLETRVQIGPFKTRAEADTAARKLRQLGIAPVIAPALNQD
ncbi:SPOR domain-containing protein [Jeongeupia wiesaeckerbachi]|uniref:SPOR domain-containing protein n=1 Tax=Jeongeupia wiesaeckerbachi TaxID=3051218 RepID=UPI003D806DB3